MRNDKTVRLALVKFLSTRWTLTDAAKELGYSKSAVIKWRDHHAKEIPENTWNDIYPYLSEYLPIGDIHYWSRKRLEKGYKSAVHANNNTIQTMDGIRKELIKLYDMVNQ